MLKAKDDGEENELGISNLAEESRRVYVISENTVYSIEDSGLNATIQLKFRRTSRVSMNEVEMWYIICQRDIYRTLDLMKPGEESQKLSWRMTSVKK